MKKLVLIKDSLHKVVSSREKQYKILVAEHFLEIHHG